jgi:hypothetical protein
VWLADETALSKPDVRFEAYCWLNPNKPHVRKVPHKRTKARPRSYFGLRGNAMNPSRFAILTFGSDCASSTSSFPMVSLR